MNFAHIGVLAASVSGWYWVPLDALGWYIAGMFGIVLQWSIFDNRCVLTDLEWWLRYQRRWEPNQGEGFLIVLANKLGVPWSERANARVPTLAIYVCITLALTRMISRI